MSEPLKRMKFQISLIIFYAAVNYTWSIFDDTPYLGLLLKIVNALYVVC